MNTRWTQGILIGLPIAAVLTVAGLVALIYGVHKFRQPELNYSDHRFEGGFLVFAGSVVLAATLGITTLATWPFDARFHQWRPVTGVVEQTSSRFISDGKAVSQRIVVRIAGKPYGCDDTRCTLLQPGDRVALTCKPEYQYAGVSGEGCEFIGSTRTGDMP